MPENGSLGFFGWNSLTMILFAILYWLFAFIFIGFYAQSDYFDTTSLSESELESYIEWIETFEDNEFSIVDIGSFAVISSISILNLPWYISILVNVLPAMILSLGIAGYIRGI